MTVEDRLKKVRDKLNNFHNNNNDKDLVVDVPAGVSERIPNVEDKVVSDNGAKNHSSYLNVVKEKLGTRLNSGKGCPTNILLYIASGRQYNDSVDPWYGQIKQLTDGAPRYHSYIHMALVCTLYPEMEKAVEMFGEKIEIKNNKGEDVNKDNKTSAADYVLIKNHIMGISKLYE